MKDGNVLVSIIVPVYDTEAYLPACIDSLCKQTYGNIQIVLVDDGSPDDCPKICDDYAKKDPRIIVIHQKNKGVSGARNTGLQNAEGDYIMFVDSDDELYSTAVEILLDDAEKYNADIISAQKKSVDENGKTISSHKEEETVVFCDDQPLLLSLNGDRNTNSSCAKLFKKSFIRGIYFEEGQNITEDGFFIFQCYARNPLLVQHNTEIYQYNIRNNSNSRQRFSDKYFSILYFCDLKMKYITENRPAFLDSANNMKVRSQLVFLDVLCSTNEKRYISAQKMCIKTVRELYAYHKPINKHHAELAWVVKHNLYTIYKRLVWLKYYR